MISNLIHLTTLWERTSARGQPYLSGYLGKARVVAFSGEPREDGTPTWDVYVAAGKEQTGYRQSSEPERSVVPSEGQQP